MSKAKKLSEKLAELDRLVEWFGQDNFDIDEAVDKFAEVEALSGEINDDLAILENKISVLKMKFDEE